MPLFVNKTRVNNDIAHALGDVKLTVFFILDLYFTIEGCFITFVASENEVIFGNETVAPLQIILNLIHYFFVDLLVPSIDLLLFLVLHN